MSERDGGEMEENINKTRDGKVDNPTLDKPCHSPVSAAKMRGIPRRFLLLSSDWDLTCDSSNPLHHSSLLLRPVRAGNVAVTLTLYSLTAE